MGITNITGITGNDVGNFESVSVTGTVSAARFVGGGAPIAMANVSCQTGTNNPVIKSSYNISTVSAQAGGSYVFTLTNPAVNADKMYPVATAIQIADQGPRTCQIRFLSTTLIHVQVWASSGFSTPSGISLVCY